METIIVRINGKLYAKAHREKWLPSLAMFVFLCKKHPGKNYYFKSGEKTKMMKAIAAKHNFGLTAFQKHIKVLQENNLITFGDNEMKLMNKSILVPEKSSFVFVPKNISDYSDIKYFLNTIPVLSNIVQQEKTIERIKRYNYIRAQKEMAYSETPMSSFKRLEKYVQSGGKMSFNSETMLSVRRMGELLERKSKNTVTAYKKFLKERGLITVYNEMARIYPYAVSFSHYLGLKKAEAISNHCFLYKNYIYENKPSMVSVAYRALV